MTPPTQSPMPEDRPLTVAQQLLWTGQHLAPDSPLYNMALAFHIDGALQPSALAAAFARLVDGCDALRTTFVETGEGPRRRVNRARVPVDYLDLIGDAEAEATLGGDLVVRARRAFRLDEPLLESALFRLEPTRFVWYLNQHHLVTDAWSATLLYRRVSELYQQAIAGRLDRVPDWPGYEEFSRHEAQIRASRRGQRCAEHWRREAAHGARPAGFYGLRPVRRSGRSHRREVPVGPDRSARVRRLARSPAFRGMTDDLGLFHVFATAVLAFVHRATDRQMVSLAAPSHSRGSATLREVAGLLIELFPLSVRVAGDDTFRSLAAKTVRASQTRLAHAAPGSSPHASTPDVVLNFIRGDFGDFAGMPARTEWIHTGYMDQAHVLRVQVYDFDRTGEFRLELDLDDEVFGNDESEWATRHLQAILDAMLTDLAQHVAAPVLTTESERAAFVPAVRYTPVPSSVAHMFSDQVARAPDAIALRDGHLVLSYRELHDRARRLARRLWDEGVRVGDRVGVLLPRSADLVAAWLAALEVGAAYVPLDPDYPDSRLCLLATDADVVVTLTDGANEARATNWPGQTLVLEERPTRGEPHHEPGDSIAVDEAQIAYVLYTSGSTGRPKGVMVSRGALANYVSWARQLYTGGKPLSFPLFTSPAFDLTVTSVFTPLVSGGAIVVYRGDNFTVRRVVEDNEVDVIKLTPSHLALIRDLPLDGSRLRTMVVGGEDLPTQLASTVHAASGGRVAIYNEYGPTEATVGCTVHRFDPQRDQGPSVPIGTPADNVFVSVVGADLRPLPRGIVGEIVIGGRGVARGYLGLDALTRERFVPDPGHPGEIVYRSGDLGRWHPGGYLEFAGRRDLQVKWRGARIELGEIETALAGFAGIRQCAASLVRAPGHHGRSRRCVHCGLEDAHPEARLDEAGVCAVCRRFAADRQRVAGYFGVLEELERILRERASAARGSHDCIMLFSGGKDSTYALCRLVDLGARPLVFHFDNGYISEQAQRNIRRVVDDLGLELVVGRTAAMDRIFVDSLRRYSNVCNGCFKTIYTLATQLAHARGIPTIVTGLSRGQIFETRLADLYRRGLFDREAIDRTILEARQAYHRMDDEVSRSLDVRLFDDEAVFDRIRFVDFYRYSEATLDEMLEYLGRRTPWIRPTDTGRSTNCRINEVGIFVHKTERGFHNYAMPYSWDVRLQHKRRDAAVAELDDHLDVSAVRGQLDRLGYQVRRPPAIADTRLVAYYAADREVASSELRRFLSQRLSPDAVPALFVRLERLPLTANGKVDRTALPQPAPGCSAREAGFVAPRSEAERALAEIWEETLGVDRLGVDDSYFELGGDSIHCIHIVSVARQRGWRFTPQQLFEHPTVAGLARVAARTDATATAETFDGSLATDAEIAEVLREFGESPG